MKIIHSDLKKGEIKCKAESLDDLWFLHQIIDSSDLVKGHTYRKVKVGDSDRAGSVIKKSVTLVIRIESVEFHKYSDVLRLSGKVVDEHEDIPSGSYHTINVEVGTILTIIKKKWLKYQIDKLNQASLEKSPPILICVFDREESYFALSKKYGYELLLKLQGDVQKKENASLIKGSFYDEIIKHLTEYSVRYNVENIILASPAFWRDELLKFLKDPILKKKIVLASCSSADETAINEVLRRPEVSVVLHKERVSREIKLVEELLTEISKDGKAKYGFSDVFQAVNSGAVSKLLVTDNFIRERRQKGTFFEVEKIMRLVEDMDGEIFIVSSENDGGRKLDGISGIAAILRYKL